METIKTTFLEKLNTKNKQINISVLTAQALYQNEVLETLNKKNESFSEFIEEQSIATDISRLGGLNPGSMLKEQLTMLGLYQKNQNSVNNIEYENEENSVFGAPSLKPKILGGMVA